MPGFTQFSETLPRQRIIDAARANPLLNANHQECNSVTLTNREIADVFDNVADLLQLKGEIIHRVLAYRRAAESIRELPRDLSVVAAEDKLKTIPNVGAIL